MASLPGIETPTRPSGHLPSLSRTWPAWLASAAASESGQLLAVVALYSFVAVLFIHRFYIVDPDIWFHLRSGDWVLAHRAVPVTDPFSSYGAGKPWMVYSWLYDALNALAFSRLGFVSIAFYEIAARVALSVAFFHLVQRRLGGFWRALALSGLALYAMTEVVGPRPGMLTVLFVIIEFDILLSARRTGNTKSLWLLPPMFALWANWHIQFVYGLFVLGVFACEPWIEAVFRYESPDGSRLPQKQLWFAVAASGLATLVNPYGPKVYSIVFDYMHQSVAYDAISELRAMTFRDPRDFIVVLIVAGASMALGWRRDAKPLWIILLTVTSLMAFRSVREIWFVLIVAACVISDGWAHAPSPKPVAPRMRLATVVCVLAVLFVSCRHYGLSNNFLDLEVSGAFPEGAARYVEQHHLPGPLLNDLSWGGFLIWRLPQLPVAIDGRMNVHGDARIQEFADLWTGKPGWASDPELIRANLVITPRVSAIASLLRTDLRFKPVYEDSQAVVFQRQ